MAAHAAEVRPNENVGDSAGVRLDHAGTHEDVADQRPQALGLHRAGKRCASQSRRMSITRGLPSLSMK